MNEKTKCVAECLKHLGIQPNQYDYNVKSFESISNCVLREYNRLYWKKIVSNNGYSVFDLNKVFEINSPCSGEFENSEKDIKYSKFLELLLHTYPTGSPYSYIMVNVQNYRDDDSHMILFKDCGQGNFQVECDTMSTNPFSFKSKDWDYILDVTGLNRF